MRGSRSRSRRSLLAALPLLVAGLLVSPPKAFAGDSARVLRVGPAADDLFAGGPAEGALGAAPGEVVVVVKFDDSAFSVPSLDRLSVVLPGGKSVPLVVETPSVLEEFGSIVAVRFAFRAAEADLTGPVPARIRWGDGVTGTRTEVPALTFAPASRERIRVATWAAEGSGDDDTRIASIEVVADSRANYYSLLYLLPMAALFALLAVGKRRARESAP